MTDRSKKALVTVDTLFHLASIGLVGAATIILFGVASVSLLGTGKEPPTGSRIGGGFQYNDGNAKPIPAPTYSPTLDSAKILPGVPPQRASTPETPQVSGGKPGFELPAPDPDPMLLCETACRKNVGQLSFPRCTGTVWRRSESIIDEPGFIARTSGRPRLEVEG